MSLPALYVNRFSVTQLRSFISVMQSLHGINIRRLDSSNVQIEGYDFHVKFTLKVLNDIAQPIDQLKVQKYPFTCVLFHRSDDKNANVSGLKVSVHPAVPSQTSKLTHRASMQEPRKFIPVKKVCNDYFNKIGYLEAVQREHNVQIDVSRSTKDDFQIEITGRLTNVERAFEAIQSNIQKTPQLKVALSPVHPQTHNIQKFLETLKFSQYRTLFFIDDGSVLWLMGEKAAVVEQKIFQQFRELVRHQSGITIAHGPTDFVARDHDTDYIVIVDPDLLKYIKLIHSRELGDMQDHHKVYFSYEIDYGFAQIKLKGTKAKQVEEKLRQFCEKLQKEICTELVDVKQKLSEATLTDLQNEFQAVVENDIIKGYVKIVADKKKAHEIREKIARKYGKKNPGTELSSGTVGAPSFAQRHPKPSAALSSSFCGRVDATSYKVNHANCSIHAHVHDITRLPVDAIVNAANDQLQHNAGVARAIAKAAGADLTTDCQRYLSKSGPLNVTANMVTRAGNLPCEYVIHAVGPMMAAYSSHRMCYDDLAETFKNCLRTAKYKQFTSVAIPALSSGHYGVPVEKVAEIMVDTVVAFLTTHSTSIRDIHLVDIGPLTVSLIQQQLNSLSQVSPVTGSPAAHLSKPKTYTTTIAIGGARPKERPSPPVSLAATMPTSPGRASLTSDHTLTSPTSSSKENCPICMDDISNPKKLSKCGHTFCKDCVDNAFKHKPVCPICGEMYGSIKGTQPENGTMRDKVDYSIELPGYSGVSVIVIDYSFPDGIQGPEHPNPGQRYKGARRTAFLPDNTEGRKVLQLLKKAFNQRVTFTIGRSSTTGQDNVVTWNDIHHKTQIKGGAQRYGYPDPTYLTRVQEELAAKGITDA